MTDIELSNNGEDDLSAKIKRAEQAVEDAKNQAIEAMQDMQQEDTGSSLVVSGAKKPEAIKRQMVMMRKKVAETQLELKARSKELEKLRKEELQRMQQEMAQIMDPMKEMMSLMQEGIESINLYLGTREILVQISEGESAPASEPVHIRQQVLSMDEETMIAAEEGGLALRDVKEFDEWLMRSPKNLNQIVPETKGIVALISRRQQKKTGQRSYINDSTDHWTYFLIKNGENVYRVHIEEFEAGGRIIPTVNEFVKYFKKKEYNHKTREYEVVDITPGSNEWRQAEKAAGARQRHFMKNALILQGLADRTAVLHPQPEGGINFLKEADYLAGRIKIIADDEKALEDGSETFREWQRRLLSQIQPGMRIVGAFNGIAWRDATHYDEYDEPRITPRRASKPKTGVPYTVESYTKEGGLKFKYKRTDEVFREVPHPKAGQQHPSGPGWVYRDTIKEFGPPKTRASCVVYPSDQFIIPFDLAEVEDMERFLTSRKNRADYVEMLPLIRSCIDAKKTEIEEEAPFRQLLVGMLMKKNDVDLEDAEDAVEELVPWYKLTNRTHRALREDEKKALKVIVAEHSRRIKAKKASGKAVKKILQSVPDALLIGRKRDGKYVILTQQDDSDVFVSEQEYGVKAGFYEKQEWKVVEPRRVATWDIAYTSDQWDSWNKNAIRSAHLSDPEIEEAVQLILTHHEEEDKGEIASIHLSPTKNNNAAESKFYVRVFSDRFVFDENHPITGPCKEPDIRPFEYSWKRNGNSIQVLNGYPHYSNKQGRVVYENKKLLDLFENDKMKYKKLREKRSKAGSISGRAVGKVTEQWEEAQWKVIYDKFIEEYLDAGLWEDHKKMYQIPRSPIGHGSGAVGQYDNHSVHEMVRCALEEGFGFDGTVQELRDFLAEEGIEKDYWKIPEEIAELHISFESDEDLKTKR